MAKKKNIPKKHRFKHVEGVVPAAVESAEARTSARPVSETRQSRAMPVTSSVRDFSYVSGDLRRIGLMAVVLVGVELIFYFLLAHTTLGTLVSKL